MTQSDRPIVRGGRRKPSNLYLQHGPEPSEDDPGLGYIHDPEVAQVMVAAYNAVLRAARGETEVLHPFVLGTSLRSSVYLAPAVLCQGCFSYVQVADLHVDTDGHPVDMCRSCAEPKQP